MADARLAWLPATELAAMIRRKKVSPVEVVDAALERIEKINPRLNAFVTVTGAAARREAKAAERTPGGSSGGASAAAAAGLGPLHIGTDGGGSIRIPASCAGVFGHKPSYGRIPTHPASGAWSLSHIGPLTRTVADAALMLTVCA